MKSSFDLKAKNVDNSEAIINEIKNNCTWFWWDNSDKKSDIS